MISFKDFLNERELITAARIAIRRQGRDSSTIHLVIVSIPIFLDGIDFFDSISCGHY